MISTSRFFMLVKTLLKSEQGSAIPLLGLAMLILIGAVGSGIDMGRAQLVQAKLSSSLDAAGLAAGTTANTQDLTATTTKYLDVNFKGYLGATITNVSVSANSDNTIITLSATANLPTTFMKVLGTDSIDVGANAEITRATEGLELVMVLDNTGSMAGSKLSSLKTAANDLVDILFGSDGTAENLWIGVVPFAQAVNISSSRTGWTEADSFDWGTTSWAGCVDAREANGRDITDDPPSVALFPKYYWPCHTSYNDWYGTNGAHDNCAIGPGLGYKALNSNIGPNNSCSQPVTPMTSTKSTINTAINNMQARGNTHINIGAAWGWRMISPRWRGLWGGQMDTDNLPLDYNTDKMNKAVIIMTDGDNTISNGSHGAYWYLNDGKLGTTSQTNAENELDDRLADICTDMKDNNILIYTISFGSLSTSSKNMLRDCATAPDYYFHSATGSDLQAAFAAIADSLSNLRVSK